MRTINTIALILVIVGAINWLLVGLFNFDLVGAIFGGATSGLARFIYVLVGLAGVWLLFTLLPVVVSTPSYRQEPSRAM